MSHHRCCCDSGPNDAPGCVGDPGFCLRITLNGITPNGACKPSASGGNRANVLALAIDGHVPANGFFRGLATFEHDRDPPRWKVSHKLFRTISEFSCTRQGRLIVRNFKVFAVGSTGVAGVSFGMDIFRIFGEQLVVGPGGIVVANEIDCGEFGGNITDTGTAKFQTFNQSPCDLMIENMLLACKCSNPDETIIVDPTTNTSNLSSCLFGDELYFICGRTTGTPVTVTWTNDGCMVPPSPIIAGGNLYRSRGLSTDAQLDAMGFDLATEERKAKQGGCCGQPSW